MLEGIMSLFSFTQEPGELVRFADRLEAGELLAKTILGELSAHSIPTDLPFAVYALPRGGLPVAEPIARALGCPLDVILAKKITLPDNSELAIGAVTADGQVIWAPHRRIVNPPFNQYHEALEKAKNHAQKQWHEFSPDGFRAHPTGTIALLVDDGIATGMTMAAAVQSLRAQQAAQVWICAPVAPSELMPFLARIGDRVIVLTTPTPFNSVSRFYQRFPQLTNEEAMSYLQ
jgi:putative phosphoribosyl transferase